MSDNLVLGVTQVEDIPKHRSPLLLPNRPHKYLQTVTLKWKKRRKNVEAIYNGKGVLIKRGGELTAQISPARIVLTKAK